MNLERDQRRGKATEDIENLLKATEHNKMFWNQSVAGSNSNGATGETLYDEIEELVRKETKKEMRALLERLKISPSYKLP